VCLQSVRYVAGSGDGAIGCDFLDLVPVTIVEGMCDVAGEIDRCRPLMERLGAPVTARGTWLTAALHCLPSGRPAAVVSRSPTGEPDGATFLTVTRSRGYAEVTLLGAHVSDHARLLATDHDVARAIAHGVRTVLDDVRGPWRLYVEQVPYRDPVLEQLAGGLAHSELTEGDVCPVTRFGADRALAAHLSKNGRGTAKQGRNRLTREDSEWRIERTRDSGAIAALLPTAAAIHRSRDHAAGRRSDFDDPRRVDFFTRVTRELAEEGCVELATLHVGGAVAAYFVVLLDGGVWRFWDGRISAAHGHLRAGRVLDVALLTAALEDPSVSAVDWMRGDLEHKRQSANDVVRTQKLTAWSSAALRQAERSARWGRERFRALARAPLAERVRNRGPGVEPAPEVPAGATRGTT
jgi:CelD/BcsL family acetyltransferase involved in cellulose biosynthesis